MNAQALLDVIVPDDDGLIPAIAQQYDTGEVLMLAWMNREAIEATVSTGQAHYWSRSPEKAVAQGRNIGTDSTDRRPPRRLRC